MAESSPSLSMLAVLRAPPAADVGGLRLRQMVEHHGDFIWRSLRRLGLTDATADDATQQVFTIAAGKLSAIAIGSERAFLFRTAMNMAAHARRGVARQRRVFDDAVTEKSGADARDPSPLPDELIDERRARALLDDVLDAMPIDLRTVFVLFEIEEITMAEIAALTGLPSGTVASRLRRAREEFRIQAARVRAKRDRAGGAP